MSDTTVVVPVEQTVVVAADSGSVVVESQDNSYVVVTGLLGTPGRDGTNGLDGIQRLSQASDVDLTNLSDGSLLIYKADSLSWKATTKLEGQVLEAGQF